MYCKECGSKLPDDALFCEECGAKTQGGNTDNSTNSTSNSTNNSSFNQNYSSSFQNQTQNQSDDNMAMFRESEGYSTNYSNYGGSSDILDNQMVLRGLFLIPVILLFLTHIKITFLADFTASGFDIIFQQNLAEEIDGLAAYSMIGAGISIVIGVIKPNVVTPIIVVVCYALFALIGGTDSWQFFSIGFYLEIIANIGLAAFVYHKM